MKFLEVHRPFRIGGRMVDIGIIVESSNQPLSDVGEMMDRQEACRFFGIKLRAWSEWERKGRVCGQWGQAKSGNRCKVYSKAELEKLRDAVRRQSEPYPDPERPNVYRVPLTSRVHRMEAIIDAADLPVVQGRNWNWSPGHREGMGMVIVAMVGTPKPGLHHFILGVTGAEQRIGHVNGDPLDCRRENLVVRNHSETARSARKMQSYGGKKCSSRYKGVKWNEEGRKWSATIAAAGKRLQLGRFRSEIDAALAYDAAARELFGEHPRLNFTDPQEVARQRALEVLEPIDTTWPPVGMVDRYEACRMFDISLTAWMVWEKKGKITCATRRRMPSGKESWCKLYPIDELERLREEFGQLGKPYRDPDRSGCYRVPLKSYLCQREVIIDEADLPVVEGRNWNWAERGDGSGGYAVLATVTGPQTPLHRMIAGVTSGEERVSFLSGDPLDCRRANLMVRTLAEQNRGNRKMGTVSGRKYTSVFKGVSWSEDRGKWVAQISLGELHKNLGRFEDEIAAAETYDEAARELFGEHARLNFPDGVDAWLETEGLLRGERKAA